MPLRSQCDSNWALCSFPEPSASNMRKADSETELGKSCNSEPLGALHCNGPTSSCFGRHCQQNNSVEILKVAAAPYQYFYDLFECITLSRSLLCNLLCTPQSPSQGEAHPSLKFCEETVESFLVKLLFSFPCSLATYLCSSAETPDGRQDVEAETTGEFVIPSYQKFLPSMRNFNFRLFFSMFFQGPTLPTHPIVLVTKVTGDLFEL
jgi:hypothetical protein